ncbi:MAG: hypothetical protein AAF579_00770 [Cyanobacteria bacterium P01_C01_bin.118]
MNNLPSSPRAQKLDVVSVQDFFAQINWYGKSLGSNETLLLTDNPYETVGQFFSTFPWQGPGDTVATNDGQIESANEVFAVEDEPLTLEDLSALF